MKSPYVSFVKDKNPSIDINKNITKLLSPFVLKFNYKHYKMYFSQEIFSKDTFVQTKIK